jgi:hypothetical protein
MTETRTFLVEQLGVELVRLAEVERLELAGRLGTDVAGTVRELGRGF